MPEALVESGDTLQAAGMYCNDAAAVREKTLPDEVEQAEKQFAGVNRIEWNTVPGLELIDKGNEFGSEFGVAAAMIVGLNIPVFKKIFGCFQELTHLLFQKITFQN